MIVVGGVFQVKYGKGDELVSLFKESNRIWPNEPSYRLMTDLSGPFFTVVTEGVFESLSAWEADIQKCFGDERFTGWFERMVPLVESGSRKFFDLVE